MTMPAPCRLRLPLATAALTLGLALAPAMAADLAAPAKPGDAHASESRTQPAQTDVRAPASKPVHAKADAGKPAVAPEVASLDLLREKLALKLGAAKPQDGGNQHVLRVASRATGEFQVAAAKPAPRVTTPAATRRGTKASTDGQPGAGNGAASHVRVWSYAGETGPDAWGAMKPEFTKCSTGVRQSPIDIRDGINVDLEPVQFDYRPSGFAVIDNGHTVQVNVGAGNSIEVMGRRYALAQFHFHRPSEERINGRQFDMVVHLVHQDLEGRLAVVAVLLDRGSAQPIVQTVWNNLPLEKGEEVAARVAIDLNQLLPPDRRYYTYMGSLTTPPCSEGVLWMVMQQPVAVSAEQIDIFAHLYPMNARPIQSAAGRLIKGSN